MKKLSYEHKCYWQRRAQKRDRWISKRSKRQGGKRGSKKFSYGRLFAPKIFTLGDKYHRAKLLKFLTRMRSAIVQRRSSLVIDFSNTEHMWAEGTLLLRAELCRVLHLTGGGVSIKCVSPRNHKVAQVLKQVEIFKLLKHKSNVAPTADDVVSWQIANGSEVDGEKYDDILGAYDGALPKSLQEGLFVGLTEAMTNCHHHAYMSPREDGLGVKTADEKKEWWMFSQLKDNLLTVVFCDLGVGIPKTIPITRPNLWQKIRLFAKDEGKIIHEAIQDSISRTGKSYRGKGLKQLRNAIDQFGNAKLLILSNKGCYTYQTGSEGTKAFRDSIMGTLISWTVPMQGAPEDES